MPVRIREEAQEMLRWTDGELNLSCANLVGATNSLVNPAESKVKGAPISLDAAVGVVAAMGMIASGFGDAPKLR